ncbi:MAG TPA: hypothetical protein VJ276_16360 [Thermoanaerobaculia bacterium]|nr:hypothetical protein [Thermoanaerobaculia bacterium]
MRAPNSDEEAALRKVMASFHRRSQHAVPPTVASLIAEWARFVQEVEVGYACSIYGYTNDLSTRDLLDELIERGPSSLAVEIERELEPWDDRYRVATRPSKRPLLPGPDVADKPRWHRMPRNLHGELLADLIADGLIRP